MKGITQGIEAVRILPSTAADQLKLLMGESKKERETSRRLLERLTTVGSQQPAPKRGGYQSRQGGWSDQGYTANGSAGSTMALMSAALKQSMRGTLTIRIRKWRL